MIARNTKRVSQKTVESKRNALEPQWKTRTGTENHRLKIQEP